MAGKCEISLTVIPLVPGLVHVPKVTLFRPSKGKLVVMERRGGGGGDFISNSVELVYNTCNRS